MAGEPDRLARLAAEAEVAARLFHPSVVAPIALEALEDELVLVRPWRDGVTLRALLDAGGRLPPDLAVRIGREVCAALAYAHGRAGGNGGPLAHGGVSAERVLVAPDGAVLLGGFGAPPPGATPRDDVRALGVTLHEALAGEPPGAPPTPLDAPGVPPALAAAVGRAVAGGFGVAESLAAALLEAVPPASPDALAAYTEAIVPPDEGERAELGRLVDAALARAGAAPPVPGGAATVARPGKPDAEEISEDLIVGSATPVPFAAPAELEAVQGIVPVPASEPTPTPEAIGDELIMGEPTPALGSSAPQPTAPLAAEREPPAPSPAPQPAVAPPAAERARPTPRPAPEPARSPSTAAALSSMPRDVFVDPTPAHGVDAGGVGAAARTPSLLGADDARTIAIPAPAARRSRFPAAIGIVCALAGFAIGLAIARGHSMADLRRLLGSVAPAAIAPAAPSGAASPPATASPAPVGHGPVAPAPETEPADEGAPAPVPGPAPRPRPAARPSLAVTAEPAGEVYVDGRRVGRAPVEVPVERGTHTVRLRDAASGVDASRRVEARGAGTPVRFALGKGWLDVTAPDAAEVFLDGRQISRGGVKRFAVWEGEHRIEVRLGTARVGERFRLAPNETWTYDVTPTP